MKIMLVIWSFVSGQAQLVTHDFVNEEACTAEQKILVEQIQARGDPPILVVCLAKG